MTKLVRVQKTGYPEKREQRSDLVAMWLDGRTKETRRAYENDLFDFARFLGAEDSTDRAARRRSGQSALGRLLGSTHAAANELVLSYRNAMVDKALSSATVNRRLAALRSLVKLANLVGQVPWLIGVEGLKKQRYRDTKGPGTDAFMLLLEGTAGTPTELRNRTILWLLYGMALRRGEVASLLLEHVDRKKQKLSIMGKGRREREWFSAPPTVMAALEAWIKERGEEPGSLFGITGDGIYSMVQAMTKRAKLEEHVRPHGLRHSGITEALDKTSGNVRAVQKFSRHMAVETLMIYDDNRRDDFGEIADLITKRVK